MSQRERFSGNSILTRDKINLQYINMCKPYITNIRVELNLNFTS